MLRILTLVPARFLFVMTCQARKHPARWGAGCQARFAVTAMMAPLVWGWLCYAFRKTGWMKLGVDFHRTASEAFAGFCGQNWIRAALRVDVFA